MIIGTNGHHPTIRAVYPRDYAALPAVHAAKLRALDAQDTAPRNCAHIPRMARLVPWRSDCLVQATAAQCWLRQKGVPTHLHIGVILTAGPVDSNVSCPDVVRLNHCPEGRRIRYDDSYHTNRP
jgi:hypothetical protein